MKRTFVIGLFVAMAASPAYADWKQTVEQLDDDLEYDKAYGIAQTEYKKNPNDYWTNYWMGNLQMNKDKSLPSLEKAKEFIIKAKSLKEDAQTLCKYASVLGRIGNRMSGIPRAKMQAEATATILKALKLDSNNTCAVGAIAVGKHYISPGGAAAEWQKLIKLDPKDYWAHANYARTLMKTGKWAEAESQMAMGLKKAQSQKLKPKVLARFYYGMALFYEDFNKFDTALKYAQMGRKVHPPYPMLIKATKRMEEEVKTKKKISNMDIDMF